MLMITGFLVWFYYVFANPLCEVDTDMGGTPFSRIHGAGAWLNACEFMPNDCNDENWCCQGAIVQILSQFSEVLQP